MFQLEDLKKKYHQNGKDRKKRKNLHIRAIGRLVARGEHGRTLDAHAVECIVVRLVQDARSCRENEPEKITRISIYQASPASISPSTPTPLLTRCEFAGDLPVVGTELKHKPPCRHLGACNRKMMRIKLGTVSKLGIICWLRDEGRRKYCELFFFNSDNIFMARTFILMVLIKYLFQFNDKYFSLTT